ncbi:MAG TPA: DUF3365 domain-containing protein [Ferruginibacter sp.]|nr:DUF3365 domain-containing protein [Ferruginibacter sp.]HRE63775.1 DUF3365 domain-containing protein [Ferruginibacter sp.]
MLNEEEQSTLKALGDSIATAAQNVLLNNVATAIQKAGTEYAVEFCNVNAVPLTDSVALVHQVTVQRLSDKSRNKHNAIQTSFDSIAWNKIKQSKTSFVTQNLNAEVYFYKPITIAMPTCIKCHGSKSDIEENTLKLIAKKYPLDKAIGYSLGDLRGMWKIKIK